MSRIAASLAAVLIATALAGCGGGGAEPDAPTGAPATLILDFQPNAVHAGIYAALAAGELSDRGVDLNVQVPGASTDAPKLLRAGRADVAVMDIQDLAIAREQGIDLVGVGALVQRPLAAVIAGDRSAIRTPVSLLGRQVGVTGLPSDEAVLAAVLDGGLRRELGASSASVLDAQPPETVTIGFDSVAALSSGRVDAVTAFWNVEGVALRKAGVPTREFRVDDYGAPRFPELILVTTRDRLNADRERIDAIVDALRAGYATVATDPDAALEAMRTELPELDPATLRAQLDALRGSFEPPLELDRGVLEDWAGYAVRYGIVGERPEVGAAFDPTLAAE